MRSDSFRDISDLNLFDKYGDTINHKELNTLIDKLRIKYKFFKQEWFKLADQIKNESRLAFDKEPHSFKHLNLVFTEVNDAISLSSNAAQTSFVNKEEEI